MILNECSNGLQWVQIIDGHKQDYLNRNKRTKKNKPAKRVNGRFLANRELKGALGFYAKERFTWRQNHGIKTVVLRYNSNLLQP